MVPAFYSVPATASAGSAAYAEQMATLHETLQPLKAAIPILFAGADAGNVHYREWCGDDYYSAWSQGSLLIVVNSELLRQGAEDSPEARRHAQWLSVQLQLAKCAAQKVFMFCAEPWYHPTTEEAAELNKPRPELADSDGEEDQQAELNAALSPRAMAMKAMWEGAVSHAFTCSASSRGERRVLEMPKVMYGQVDLESVEAPMLGDGEATEGHKYNHQGAGVRIARVFEPGVNHEFHKLDSVPTSARLLPKDYNQ